MNTKIPDEVEITAISSYFTHVGMEERITSGQIRQQRESYSEHLNNLNFFHDFEHGIGQCSKVAKIERQRFSRRMNMVHFDGGITTDHYEILKIIIPSAVVCVAIIKECSKIIIELIKHCVISIKSGSTFIQVGNAEDLKNAITALERLAKSNASSRVKENKPVSKEANRRPANT